MSHSDNHMIESTADLRASEQHTARAEEFDLLTAKIVSATNAAIQIGDERQLKFAADTVRDALTEPGAMELLVREAALCGAEAVGKSFVRMLDKAIQDDAEASAEQELMRRQRKRSLSLCVDRTTLANAMMLTPK